VIFFHWILSNDKVWCIYDDLSIFIPKPNEASGHFLPSSFGHWQNQGSNSYRSLIMAFKTITTMFYWLGYGVVRKGLVFL
jgi:hypothetical protein